MTLTEFLLARIAEDEADARAAGGEEWYPVKIPGETMRKHPDEPTVTVIDSPRTLVSHEVVSDEMAEHIVTFDPARVLAECEAKRRIAGAHPDYGGFGETCATCQTEDSLSGDPWPCLTLRLLAQPYADHPDFRDEWRP